jgi:purine-binding chemotaxis protein CheW
VATAPVADASSIRQRNGKYLVFQIGLEEYGVHVLKVREIMGLQEITAVPQMPAHVRGVINLRGKVIPVVDLRRKFGFESAQDTARTCVIVLQIVFDHMTGNEGLSMGAIVDGVSEVLTLQEQEIENTPEFGAEVETPYLLGMAKVKGKVKILLDIDKALSAREVRGLQELSDVEY